MKQRHMLLFILLPILLTGCWDRVEINDIAIAVATGLDRADDDPLKITVQIFTPPVAGGGSTSGGSGSGGQAGGGDQPTVFSATGKDISDTLGKLQRMIARRLYGGHNEVFIISEELAREGVRGYTDFYLRLPITRGTALFYVSKTETKEILNVRPRLRRSSSETLENFNKLHIGSTIGIGSFAEMLANDVGAAFAPTIRPGKKEDQTETQIVQDGIAVFREGKLVGTLNEKESQGALFLRNELPMGHHVTVIMDGSGYATARVSKGRVKLIPHYANGRWELTVRGKIKCELRENTTNIDLATSERQLQAFEQKVSDQLKKDTNQALTRLQNDLKADILGFGEAFRRKYPKMWHQHKQRWNDDIFPSIKVSYDIDIIVLDPGKRTLPSGWPPDEVKR